MKLINQIIDNSISSTSIDIFEEELIDSFAIVEIVTSLEKLFNIKIPFEEMIIQNFRSIDTIDSLIYKIQKDNEKISP
tara:strand:+ start:3681 stop:3914 length:234 start_codon:yes stop_codon:yes gene_type:complete